MPLPTLHNPADRPPPTPNDQGKGAFSDELTVLVPNDETVFATTRMVYVGEGAGDAAGWYNAFLRVRVAPPLAWFEMTQGD